MNKVFLIGILAISFIACESDTETTIDDPIDEIEDVTETDEEVEVEETPEVEVEETPEVEELEETTEEEMIDDQVEKSEVLEEELIVGTIGSGTFQPNDPIDGYDVEGSFSIIRNSDGVVSIVIDNDYKALSNRGDEAPDLVLYLSNENDNDDDASFVSENILGTTAQTFEVPEGLKPEDYTYVLLYCRDFNFEIGFGLIER